MKTPDLIVKIKSPEVHSEVPGAKEGFPKPDLIGLGLRSMGDTPLEEYLKYRQTSDPA